MASGGNCEKNEKYSSESRNQRDREDERVLEANAHLQEGSHPPGLRVQRNVEPAKPDAEVSHDAEEKWVWADITGT